MPANRPAKGTALSKTQHPHNVTQGANVKNVRKPELRLLPPQRVADGDAFVPLAFTLADTARLLGGCSVRHVQRLIEDGELEAIGQRKLRRVLYDSIVAYINRQRNGGE
jgi:hypothetical protein